MTKSDCPDQQTLRQYLLGECADPLSEDVERHLADCPVCEDTIAQFDTSSDTLMRHLPLAACANQSLSPSPGWLDVLRQQPPTDQAPNSPQAASGNTEPRVADADPPLNDGFANYIVLGVLGRGGMGVVFLARHKQLNRRVALKVVRPDALSSETARRRFQREIQILGGLNHPGIVMATDAGVVGRGAYLVMEWIDGADLGRLVRQTGPLTIEEASEVGRQIAEALATAHDNGVVHRDVKPSNAMVDRHGRVRLLDFGLAHMTRIIQESGDTSVGQLLGTLDYMAPEQADGQGEVDARSDLYALGALMFFLLTGRPPHGARAGRSILEHLRAISQDEAPHVRAARVDVPEELDALIARLLRRHPSDRPQSATDVAMELKRWAGGNLVARVAELKSSQSGPTSEADESKVARQSLAVLLGDEDIRAAVPESQLAEEKSVRKPTRWSKWWLAIVPLLMVLAAVIVTISTPQGTLKIESMAGDISVELVDDKDNVRELKIHAGDNETVLAAGQYRVRMTGTHDGLELDHDVITLKRGKDSTVKITRIPATEPAAVAQKPDAKSERLYQGRTESEWLQQFRLETEPATMMDAASALLSLAAVLPPAKQTERILDIGEQLVQSGWNEPYIDYVYFAWTVDAVPRWPQTYLPETNRPKMKFYNSLNDQMSNLPSNEIISPLLKAILKGTDARSAFAASLLTSRIQSMGYQKAKPDLTALQLIQSELNVPLTGLDRTAVSQLLRIACIRHLDEEQRASIRPDLLRLANLLNKSPKSRVGSLMKSRLLTAANDLYGPGWPTELSESLARLVLSNMTEGPVQNFSPSLYGNPQGFTFVPNVMGGMGGGGGMMPPGMGMGGGMGGMGGVPADYFRSYDPHTVKELRKSNRHFIDAWIDVTNEYLEAHKDGPMNSQMFNLIRSIETTTRIYSQSDKWPVDRTAQLLTQILSHEYVERRNSKELADSQNPNSNPMVVSDSLMSIVRITGRIPDFVIQGHLRSGATRDKLNKLERFFKSADAQLYLPSGIGTGLPVEAPFETVNLILQLQVLNGRPYSNDEYNIKNLFASLIHQMSGRGQVEEDLSIDPILLLTILDDIAGENEQTDVQIGRFFKDESLSKPFHHPLKLVLESSLKSRSVVHKLLKNIATKSKSADLTSAVLELFPEAKDDAASKK